MTRFGGFTFEEVETLVIALGNDPGFADVHGKVDALLTELNEELEIARNVRALIGKEDEMTMSWTQPACEDCFAKQYPGRSPARLREPTEETCCFCGSKTDAGVYVRVDPENVPHATLKKVD